MTPQFHLNNNDGTNGSKSMFKVLGNDKIDLKIKHRIFNEFLIFAVKNPEYFTESICNIFLLTFLICFFSSTNFDYRLIYLLIPALKYINSIKSNIKMSCSLGVLLILTSWLSYNSGDLQLFGDICILIWVAIFVRSILIELKDSRIFKIKFFDFIFKQLV